MERIKLNLIPSGVAPIVHLSQYDDGRQFGIDLFEGESVYVLDGTETLTVNSRKPDGHVVTLSVTNTGTSSLDVDTIEQLTAVHGLSYAKLQIVKGSVTIATLPFLIDVSRDPLENGDPSESFVHNLRTQIADGVAEEVAEQYDSANVIFDANPTSGHGNGYTVTSEGIKTGLDGKVDTTDFDATNLPITSGSATNTKDYIDSKCVTITAGVFTASSNVNVLRSTLIKIGNLKILSVIFSRTGDTSTLGTVSSGFEALYNYDFIATKDYGEGVRMRMNQSNSIGFSTTPNANDYYAFTLAYV